MPAALIHEADARVTETPNAVMTTLGSPTQGGTSDLSLWRVAMAAGQSGPRHSFDVEQVWYVASGSAAVVTDEGRVELAPGDTIVLPARGTRQISTDAGVTFVVAGRASGLATPSTSEGDGEAVAPPWVV
ncbi:hypothetical protein ASG90_16090 [Nocardioides sp. Soil797]|nr:hypothetical protein ASG90_16090 [Nocardioides sp. Soil797]